MRSTRPTLPAIFTAKSMKNASEEARINASSQGVRSPMAHGTWVSGTAGTSGAGNEREYCRSVSERYIELYEKIVGENYSRR